MCKSESIIIGVILQSNSPEKNCERFHVIFSYLFEKY